MRYAPLKSFEMHRTIHHSTRYYIHRDNDSYFHHRNTQAYSTSPLDRIRPAPTPIFSQTDPQAHSCLFPSINTPTICSLQTFLRASHQQALQPMSRPVVGRPPNPHLAAVRGLVSQSPTHQQLPRPRPTCRRPIASASAPCPPPRRPTPCRPPPPDPPVRHRLCTQLCSSSWCSWRSWRRQRPRPIRSRRPRRVPCGFPHSTCRHQRQQQIWRRRRRRRGRRRRCSGRACWCWQRRWRWRRAEGNRRRRRSWRRRSAPTAASASRRSRYLQWLLAAVGFRGMLSAACWLLHTG
jgi:hypothetical protein